MIYLFIIKENIRDDRNKITFFLLVTIRHICKIKMAVLIN